jgi:hypothetical protein
VRNLIVHGERVPEKYNGSGRKSVNGNINRMSVLFEGLSFILRKSLLRIFQDNLLEEFKDRSPSRKFWKNLSLTRRYLLGKSSVLKILKETNKPLKVAEVVHLLNEEKKTHIKLHTDPEITKYLKAGVSDRTIRDNGNGTFDAL